MDKTLSIFISDITDLPETIKNLPSDLTLRCFLCTPNFSITTSQKDSYCDLFTNLTNLFKTIHTLNQNLIIGLNCDILPLETELPLLQELFSWAKKMKITHFRIQDPGLITLIHNKIKNPVILFAPLTGYCNQISVEMLSELVTEFEFNNEWDYESIAEVIKKRFKTNYTIMLQGPQILHYSKRHYLQGYDTLYGTKFSQDLSYITDQDFPDYKFRILDTKKHCTILHHFDIFLGDYYQKLLALGFFSFMLDVRHEKKKQTIIRAYLNSLQKQQLDNKKIQQLSSTPLASGFFLQNTTDQNFCGTAVNKKRPELTIIGSVIDVVKHNCITIALEKQLKTSDLVLVLTPENKQFKTTINNILDLQGTVISQGLPGEIIKIKWLKGVVPKSLLIKI